MKSQNASHEAVRCSGPARRFGDMYGAYMVKTLKVHEEYIEALNQPPFFYTRDDVRSDCMLFLTHFFGGQYGPKYLGSIGKFHVEQ